MATIGKPYYKYCLVPYCTNTTMTAPDKLFLSVPKDRRKRDAWTKAMKRDSKNDPALSTKTTRWCCEDHFTLEEDLENYWQWKLTGNVKRLELKDGVVPHRFECQSKTLSPPVRKGELKRKHIALVQAALSAFESEPSSSNFDEDPNLIDKSIQVNIVKHFRSTTIPLGRPRKCFLGDFNESDMECPENARRVLQLVKEVLRKKRSTVQSLKNKTLRYEKNIAKLKDQLYRTERKLHLSLSGDKSDTTTVDHDVSGSLEMELNTVEPESDHETSTVPAIAMKEEPVSDPEDDAPYPGASTTPSLTSVTSLAKFPPSSGEILGVPFGDLPTRSPPPMSPGSEVSNSATNGGPDKTRFLPSTSPANDSGEEAKFVPDYRTRDQFDVYGEYIASKLRRLDWRTCAHVQKAFSDIIFDAEMGKYS